MQLNFWAIKKFNDIHFPKSTVQFAPPVVSCKSHKRPPTKKKGAENYF